VFTGVLEDVFKIELKELVDSETDELELEDGSDFDVVSVWLEVDSTGLFVVVLEVGEGGGGGFEVGLVGGFGVGVGVGVVGGVGVGVGGLGVGSLKRLHKLNNRLDGHKRTC
jgi:hypothetical protein